MQEKEAKGTQIGKEKGKPSLFLDVILSIWKIVSKPLKKIRVSEFSRVTGYKMSMQNKLYFCTLAMSN